MPRETKYRRTTAADAEIDLPDELTDPPAPSNRVLDEQRTFDEQLRPTRLSQVIGQRKVKERLQIVLDATRMRQTPLGHLLLDGPPGLGKTTLATVIPRELDTEIQFTSGPALKAPKDLVPYLTNAISGSVLFIDEIHRLPPAVEEYLYSAMEDFRVDIVLGEGTNARTLSIDLKPFTVIGATTRSGMLTAPLRDRFVHQERLTYYDTAELTEIVQINAKKLSSDISDDAAREIAIRCRGTPRRANNLLRWARDYAEVHGGGTITDDIANRALEMREIDKHGLDEQDRRYLTTLIDVFTGGPAGLSTLSHSLSIPADTLEDEVEPFLLRTGLIRRTPRGRTVTPAGWEHVGRAKPDNDGDRSLFG
ncbi:Holliday junction branch migration DNA helicase RuvB [Stratiformator vulcanicus]|uniref:Holliday junction branch migration complex subunit RuvB n=1 Tax=Stratiformator vulcanicus TaxID=2527980 RepID=A0A517R4S8_9PLAN|nr:Holliday junction branch migration DNA helicase RuvB [Stratiformator vulcanicus]QDT38888.1 Holliday junction ATP-dependent DNA helicase RuvB [Stratiformator vulcanicus]